MTAIDPVLFGVGVLGVWRVSSLLHAEAGPFDVFERLRGRAGDSMIGRMLACLWCVSLWVAAPVAFVVAERLILRALCWPALSAGAILLERLIHPPASWREEAPPAQDTGEET